MLENIDAVLFDLDGTLVDSMWIWEAIDRQFLKSVNCTMPDNLQADIEGKSFYETAQYFKDRFQLSQSIDEIMHIWNEMAYQKYSQEVSLKANVRAFLDLLKEKNIKIGISTSNSRILTEAVVNRTNTGSYFDVILTGCEAGAGKPAPDVYLNTADRLRVKPQNCLVFEDLAQGIRAGKAAGMKVCAVKDKYSEYQLKEKIALADYFIEDYEQIISQYKEQRG